MRQGALKGFCHPDKRPKCCDCLSWSIRFDHWFVRTARDEHSNGFDQPLRGRTPNRLHSGRHHQFLPEFWTPAGDLPYQSTGGCLGLGKRCIHEMDKVVTCFVTRFWNSCIFGIIQDDANGATSFSGAAC